MSAKETLEIENAMRETLRYHKQERIYKNTSHVFNFPLWIKHQCKQNLTTVTVFPLTSNCQQ